MSRLWHNVAFNALKDFRSHWIAAGQSLSEAISALNEIQNAQKSAAAAGATQPAAESSQSAARTGSGGNRSFSGRAQTDRMMGMLLQIPGSFTLGLAAQFLSNRGFSATKPTICQACARLVKQGKFKKIGFGLYAATGGTSNGTNHGLAAPAAPAPVNLPVSRDRSNSILPLKHKPGHPRNPDPDDALPAQPQPPQWNVDPRSARAVTLSATLPASFTLLDVSVRAPKNQAGLWLADWKARGWVETVGPGQFRKTTIFGQHAKA